MSSSILVRWGSLGALLAAAGWTVSGIVALIFGVAPFGPVGSLSWYLIESSDAIAEMGMMVLLVGLHVRETPNYGRLGTAGFVLAFVGTASIFLASVIYILAVNGSWAIFDILEYAALFGLFTGFPLLGIATFRAKVLPRWCGLLLIALRVLPGGLLWSGTGIVWPLLAGVGLRALVSPGRADPISAAAAGKLKEEPRRGTIAAPWPAEETP
jgi:hypothetical protein